VPVTLLKPLQGILCQLDGGTSAIIGMTINGFGGTSRCPIIPFLLFRQGAITGLNIEQLELLVRLLEGMLSIH
jgi:hypothetical protein